MPSFPCRRESRGLLVLMLDSRLRGNDGGGRGNDGGERGHGDTAQLGKEHLYVWVPAFAGTTKLQGIED